MINFNNITQLNKGCALGLIFEQISVYTIWILGRFSSRYNRFHVFILNMFNHRQKSCLTLVAQHSTTEIKDV